MAEMFVQPVAVERRPWSGTGTFVSAREINAARADLNSGGPAARVRAESRLHAMGQRD